MVSSRTGGGSGGPSPPATSLPLSKGRRRLSFERRLRLSLFLLVLPAPVLLVLLLGTLYFSPGQVAVFAVFSMLVAAGAVGLIVEQTLHPLYTLTNVVAALREGDYSFRARGARRDDALGQLALEVNALATAIQAREGNATEAIALLEQVMRAMTSPVLAFSPRGELRLLNAAAERALGLHADSAQGRGADELGLGPLLLVRDDEIITLGGGAGPGTTRWVARRSSFRLRGVPNTLLVLSDVSAALREQERQAWQRLIRVMGHEINNSLTPIKSVAGSLQGYLQSGWSGETAEALQLGLRVIENRADSLNRFLGAYAQLSGLPAPRLAPASLPELLQRVARVETRLAVRLGEVPPITLQCDADQLEQALINLVQNGADAALSGKSPMPSVEMAVRIEGREVIVAVRDNGPGIANRGNLFVPFYTTKPHGTGIGLVLALQILEGHGGTVRLHNRSDAAGGESEVVLPLDNANTRAAARTPGAAT